MQCNAVALSRALPCSLQFGIRSLHVEPSRPELNCSPGSPQPLATRPQLHTRPYDSQATYPELTCTEKAPTCGGTCGKVLPCGRHTCQERCHPGECASCRAVVAKTCRCGKMTKEVGVRGCVSVWAPWDMAGEEHWHDELVAAQGEAVHCYTRMGFFALPMPTKPPQPPCTPPDDMRRRAAV